MSDNRKRVVAEVDADAKAVLDEKLGHGELSEYIRDLVNTVAYGGGWDRQQAIDKQLTEKRRELEALRDQRRQLDGQIETVENEIRSLEHEREQIESKQEQFEGALWSFEQSFRAGEIGHVDPNHGRLRALADEFGKDVQDVHELLRERNPDIPGRAFDEYDARKAQRDATYRRFDGLRADRVGTPVDEREQWGER